MRKSTCRFDFRDVRKALARFDDVVHAAVSEVGRQAVDYAVENGSYRDRTGNLRRSNRYEVDKRNNLRLYNEADYAQYVEAKGYDVISGAALFAEGKLKDMGRKAKNALR